MEGPLVQVHRCKVPSTILWAYSPGGPIIEVIKGMLSQLLYHLIVLKFVL